MTSLRILLAALALLVVASTPASAQRIGAGTSPLFATLDGLAECDGSGQCRKGDPDAHGSVTIIFPTGTSLCFAILVDNLGGATAAHIHRGRTTEVGGVVVSLTPPGPPSAGNPGTSSGCVAGLTSALVRELRGNPSAFYVNVHNDTFPAGAVRGQLF